MLVLSGVAVIAVHFQCCCGSVAVDPGLSTRRLRRSTDACYNCGDRAHKVKDCPHPPTCLACGQPGHKFARCPNAAPIDLSSVNK